MTPRNAPLSTGTSVPLTASDILQKGRTPPEPDAQARILVVDDVFDNRDILVRRLSRRGFNVAEAAGGVEALRMIEETSYDLVLLDIMMPDLSGNEVLRRIRETHSPVELPVIMVTAKSHSEDVVESLDLGANDYITKPLDFAVALARINSHLARKRSNDVDTSQRRAAEDRLQYLAFHDGLTGLLNRTAFREIVGMALAEPERIEKDAALLFVDLDRFKAVNDVFGHEVGDNLLRAVADRLRGLVGEHAPLARLGGDEFGAFLNPVTSWEDAAAMGERVVAALCEPFEQDGRQFQIGASCGVACAKLCKYDLGTLVKAADIAMYRAKATGRDRCVVYDPTMLAELEERSALEVELRQAILEDKLDVVYQPLVNAGSLDVTTFEALVRWNHPTLGSLTPDAFIPVAEETGMIVGLGALVLRRACAEATTWPDDIRLAVNISPLQFRNNDLIDILEEALGSSGLAPHRLEIEITETALLEAREQNLEILRRIRALGVRVAMDDFGTGYSSIGYLQSFEFDKIKIDRRFVRDLKPGETTSAIVKAISDLGIGIGVDLTAEGVETDEEMAALTAYGCTEMQGFLFSRPLPAEEARAYIDRTRRRSA